MFIYADESGNSGRNLFDSNEWYRLGAILSAQDVAPVISDTLKPILKELNSDRIHAKDLREEVVAIIGLEIFAALDSVGPWKFHVTAIHKPYVVTTKFVDTVFDSGENIAVPPLWYNSEIFRHAICCAIDELLTPRNRERFWSAYLADSYSGIQACIRNANTYLDRKIPDARLRQVIRDSFEFALRNPEEFTLLASKGRRAYQGHTPNMIAFLSLLEAIHSFVGEHDSPPLAFFHDQQDEFRRSMMEMHELFGPLRHIEDPRGMRPRIDRAEYDLAKFSMPSSKDMPALQAVDVFLWTVQREPKNDELERLKSKLQPRISDFYISRGMSELIVRGRLHQLEKADLSLEQWIRGQSNMAEFEKERRRRLVEFEAEKRGKQRG